MIVYSAPGCPQCRLTIRWLEDHGREYEKRDARQHRDALLAMGHASAPVVVLDTGESFSGFRPDRLATIAASEPPPPEPARPSLEAMTPAERLQLQHASRAPRGPETTDMQQSAEFSSPAHTPREAIA